MTSGLCKAILYRVTGIFWIWTAAVFGFAPSTTANEASLMQEFADLEIQGYANPKKAQARLLEILDSLDSQTMRRVWLRGFTFLEAEHREKRFQGNYDLLVKEALALNDLHSYVRLLWIQAKSIQQNAPRSQVAELYALAAGAACDDLRDAILCGGTRMQENEYYFYVSDLPEVVKVLEQAMSLFENLPGPARVYYYRARLYLANVSFRKNEFTRSIEINEENLQWFTDHGFTFLADVAAGNIANTLTKIDPPDTKRIIRYLDISEELATQIQDLRQIAYIHLGRGRLLMQQKPPEFAAARQLFEKSFKIYTDLKIHDFAALGKIEQARAWLGTGHIKEAWHTIQQTEGLLPPNSRHEQMMILDVKQNIAIAEGDYKSAHTYMQRYHELWKAQKQDEEAKGLEQLSTNLNLKVQEQRNKVLKEQNDKQAAELKMARILLIFGVLLLVLTVVAIGSSVAAWRKNRMLQKSRAKIQRILSTIDEGLLTIDRDHRIGEDFSQHLSQIIDPSKPIAGADFVSRILAGSHLSNDELNTTRAVLNAVLGEKMMAWEVNSANLPSEMQIGEDTLQTIKIRWIPIFNREQSLSGLLVSLTDVTQERFLERTLGAQKKHLQSLPDALREILSAKPELTKILLEKTEALLGSLESRGGIEKILRDLHTHKGEARTLGLRSLSQVLHDLESFLNLQNNHDAHGAYVGEQIAMVRARIIEYRSFADILHRDKPASSDDDLWLGSPMGKIFGMARHNLQAAQLVLNEIIVRDAHLDWTPEHLNLIRTFALHALNNCIDHGFVIPSGKGQSLDKPTLEISARAEDNTLLVEIRDNGAGLNFEKLSEIARIKGFVPSEGQSVADVVFQDGVSTADKITISSGRGMGLAAVRVEFESLGGRVGIRSHSSGRGTVLWGMLPLRDAGRKDELLTVGF